MDGCQQRPGECEPDQPAQRVEHGGVHVVEDEDLRSEHIQPVQVVRPLLMLEPGDRCLQRGDVSLERHRHPVPEPSGEPGVHHGHQPYAAGDTAPPARVYQGVRFKTACDQVESESVPTVPTPPDNTLDTRDSPVIPKGMHSLHTPPNAGEKPRPTPRHQAGSPNDTNPEDLLAELFGVPVGTWAT